jgi:hypothetical protein
MYFRLNPWKHRTTIIAASIALTFASTASSAEPPVVIEQGSGWQLMLVQPEVTGAQIATLTDDEPAAIVVVDSAEGLIEAPLPDVIKQELSAEFGNGVEPVSLAVHYDIATAIADGTAADLYAEFLEPDAEGAGAASGKSLGCSTGWRHRNRNFERSFNGFHYEKNLNSGGFTGDILVDAPLTGNGTIDVEYAFKKTSFCLPYTVKFVQARAQAALDVGDTLLQAQGTANYATDDRKVMLKPSLSHAFMIGPIPVVVGAEFPMGAGYDIAASASASVALKSRAQGQMVIDVTCTNAGCARTANGNNQNTVTFDDLVNPGLSGSVSVQVDAKPYAFVEARGFLYASRIASAGVGIEVSAPSRLFYYLGNTCGNGTGAAASELVNGGYVDVGAQIEFYWNATALDRDRFNWFDTPIDSLGGFFREVNVDRHLRGGDAHTALRGKLYFADFQFGSGKSPLSPMFTGPATIGMGGTGSFAVSKRSCVPMDEALNYIVTWGDGASSPLQGDPGATASATHTFNAFGTPTLTAKMTVDVAGRTINESTSRVLTVNANAAPPTPASINVPASDTDGAFTVSWASSVNTASYKLFRSNAGGAYALIETVTGTSKSLTSQPFGSNRYAVQACNNIGCSASLQSGNIIIGVVPGAPVLTVTSNLCHGSNEASWTAPAGATSYKLFGNVGTNPNSSGVFYTGPDRFKAVNVTSATNFWVKACGTGGCSGFSNMDNAIVLPGCN